MSLFKNSKLYFSLLYLFLATIFIFHYFVSGQAVYGDGIGYYSYLHSWYFDADANFTNEYKHIYSYENNNSLSPIVSGSVQIVGSNSKGDALNHFSPGMAILLLPFYVLADGATNLANFFGASLPRHGYSNIYQIIVGVGAISYTLIAIWISEQLLGLFSLSKRMSRFSVLTFIFNSNLIYYLAFDTINSHFASFFLSTLFFWYYFKNRTRFSFVKYLRLGAIVGLLFLTRPQDILISLVVFVDILLMLKNTKITLRQFFLGVSIFMLPLITSIIILISQWVSLFDTVSSHPYFSWMTSQSSLSMNFYSSLLDITNGLFFRTPIILICFCFYIYLLLKRKVDERIVLMSIFIFVQHILISFKGGWQAAAYGGRMYISTYPFFIILLSELLSYLQKKYSRKAAIIFATLFISLNIISAFSFVLFEKEASGGRFGTEEHTSRKIQLLIKSGMDWQR